MNPRNRRKRLQREYYAELSRARTTPGRGAVAPVIRERVANPDDPFRPLTLVTRLDENPNRGKRHAPRLGATVTPVLTDEHGVTRAGKTRGEYIGVEREQPYAPLTVTTPARNERGNIDRRMRASTYRV